jgi:hypothetical protein
MDTVMLYALVAAALPVTVDPTPQDKPEAKTAEVIAVRQAAEFGRGLGCLKRRA